MSLSDKIGVLFDPRFWQRKRPVCHEWDAILSGALDNHEARFGEFEAELGPLKVWVSNFPYAYGRFCHCDGAKSSLTLRQREALPRRRIALRLRALQEATMEEERQAQLDILRKAAAKTTGGAA